MKSHEWTTPSKCQQIFRKSVSILTTVFFSSSYLVSMGVQVIILIVLATTSTTSSIGSSTPLSVASVSKETLEYASWIFQLTSTSAGLLLNLIAMTALVLQLCKKPMEMLPFHVVMLAPYTLTSCVRQYLDTDVSEVGKYVENFVEFQESKTVVAYIWFHGMLILIGGIVIYLGYILFAKMKSFLYCNCPNICKTNVRKKILRFLDTSASILMLAGMILGFSSLFIDNFDILMDPEGFAKDIADATKNFKEMVSPVSTALTKIVDQLDRKFTCEDVYSALGTGTAVTLFMSFFPGAGSVASVGSKSAYYGVRAANALTNLAKKLRKSAAVMWKTAYIVIKLNKFVLSHLKQIILGTNSVSISKLLPLLPPVVLGIYILFGVFWPRKLIFFSAKQRRKHISGRFYSWSLALIVLTLAVVINTVLLDEFVILLDENIPMAKVTLRRELGWQLAMTASGLALIGTFMKWVVSLVIMLATDKDHENLTNAELDWKAELDERELTVIKTPLGEKIEKKTQLKYKRSRISPWNWVLPILLTTIACGFAVSANFYPKLEMVREPRGPFGRIVDKVFKQLSLFENDLYTVRNDSDKECLPYPTLDDFIAHDKHTIGNILTGPVDKFINITNTIVKPLKDVLAGARKQLILDKDDSLWDSDPDNVWEANNLQYIGMIFVIPRAICLFILIFGALTASVFLCNMQIMCQVLEPRRIVSAYGKVAIFSLVFVIGAQMSLYNMLTSFGVPFYHIYVQFSSGFIYDVVADSIILATYVGMNNEFFFAIPKRKTIVVYSVPGVSDEGPNIPGQII